MITTVEELISTLAKYPKNMKRKRSIKRKWKISIKGTKKKWTEADK